MSTDSKKEQNEQCTIPVVVCSCGGVDKPYHPVGENGCLRYHVTDPKEMPRNKRRKFIEHINQVSTVYDIGDQIGITEHTVFQQRLYAVDENGNWTRPKSKESRNSLEGDW